MTQRSRHSAIAAIIPVCLLSVAMLIPSVHYDVARAKSRTAGAVACGNELKKHAAEWK
jgi:hypothetical protein